jgi:acyl-CoA thioesterase I
MTSMIHAIALLILALQVESPRPTILAIGDSMTAGYGVPAESSYPAQLEMELKKRGYDYRVVNYGLTGSTTAQALGRMTRALGLQAEIVIIQLGGNDGVQGIPREVSRENLRTMINRFKPGGARIFFAGGRFPHLDELARELKIPVVPFLEGVRGNPDLLLEDGSHPTGEGYTIVVQNMLKALEPVIKKRSVVQP